MREARPAGKPLGILLLAAALAAILVQSGGAQQPPQTTTASPPAAGAQPQEPGQAAGASAASAPEPDAEPNEELQSLVGKFQELIDKEFANVSFLLKFAVSTFSDQLPTDKLKELAAMSEKQTAYWEDRYGPESWQAKDWQRHLANLRRLTELDSTQRLEVAEARAALLKGMNLQRNGEFEQAVSELTRAGDSLSRTVGEESLEFSQSQRQLAAAYAALGRYDQAERLYRRALEIDRRVLGEEHPEYGIDLFNLAALLQVVGRSEEVAGYLGKSTVVFAKAMRSAVWDPVQGIHALAYMGGVARLNTKIGRTKLAEFMLPELIKKMREVLPAVVDSQKELQELQKILAHPSAGVLTPEAEAKLMVRARDYVEPLFLTFYSSYVDDLRQLADLRQASGSKEPVEPLLLEAAQIAENHLGETHPDYAASLDRLASFYSSTGQYEKAERLFRQALEVQRKSLGEEHPSYALSLGNLAAVLAAEGKDAEASASFLASARAQWKYLTQNFPAMSVDQKRQFLAQSAFTQSARLASLVFADRGDPKDGLRGVLLSKQLLAEVARQESGALTAALAAAGPEWRALWQQRNEARRRYATLALAAISDSGPQAPGRDATDPDQLRSLAAHIQELERQLRQTNPVYAAAARLQQVTLDDVTRALRPGEALVEYVQYEPYDFAQRRPAARRYGAFVVLGGSGRVAVVDLGEAAGVDLAVRRVRENVRGFIEQWKNNGEITPSAAALRRQQREDPENPGVLSETRTALASAQLRARVWQPLEPDLAAVERVYVAPDGELSLVPFDALAKRDANGAWRYLAEDREILYLGTGRDLGRLALSESAAAGRPHTAVLIGDPAFDAKPQETAAVIAGLAIANTPPIPPAPANPAPATSAVSSTSAAPFTETASLGAAAGGGTLRHEVPRSWPRLTALTDLVRRAEAQLKRPGWSVTTWTGAAAIEEAAESVAAPSILQFATHGYVLDKPEQDARGWDNPLLRSMLILAGANNTQPGAVYYHLGPDILTEAEARARGMSEEQLRAARVEVGDGILTAYEVTGMDLQGTQLVNLTACETGLGEVTPDGVAGLRQAFLLAGARSLSMSMWEVPAEETTLEIGDFYDRWLGGAKAETRYKAFRAAQLAALARARQQHAAAHPFYWAGVVYVGDPGDLTAQRK